MFNPLANTRNSITARAKSMPRVFGRFKDDFTYSPRFNVLGKEKLVYISVVSLICNSNRVKLTMHVFLGSDFLTNTLIYFIRKNLYDKEEFFPL